jgi:hypothetical protein
MKDRPKSQLCNLTPCAAMMLLVGGVCISLVGWPVRCRHGTGIRGAQAINRESEQRAHPLDPVQSRRSREALGRMVLSFILIQNRQYVPRQALVWLVPKMEPQANRLRQ